MSIQSVEKNSISSLIPHKKQPLTWNLNLEVIDTLAKAALRELFDCQRLSTQELACLQASKFKVVFSVFTTTVLKKPQVYLTQTPELPFLLELKTRAQFHFSEYRIIDCITDYKLLAHYFRSTDLYGLHMIEKNFNLTIQRPANFAFSRGLVLFMSNLFSESLPVITRVRQSLQSELELTESRLLNSKEQDKTWPLSEPHIEFLKHNKEYLRRESDLATCIITVVNALKDPLKETTLPSNILETVNRQLKNFQEKSLQHKSLLLLRVLIYYHKGKLQEASESLEVFKNSSSCWQNSVLALSVSLKLHPLHSLKVAPELEKFKSKVSFFRFCQTLKTTADELVHERRFANAKGIYELVYKNLLELQWDPQAKHLLKEIIKKDIICEVHVSPLNILTNSKLFFKLHRALEVYLDWNKNTLLSEIADELMLAQDFNQARFIYNLVSDAIDQITGLKDRTFVDFQRFSKKHEVNFKLLVNLWQKIEICDTLEYHTWMKIDVFDNYQFLESSTQRCRAYIKESGFFVQFSSSNGAILTNSGESMLKFLMKYAIADKDYNRILSQLKTIRLCDPTALNFLRISAFMAQGKVLQARQIVIAIVLKNQIELFQRNVQNFLANIAKYLDVYNDMLHNHQDLLNIFQDTCMFIQKIVGVQRTFLFQLAGEPDQVKHSIFRPIQANRQGITSKVVVASGLLTQYAEIVAQYLVQPFASTNLSLTDLSGQISAAKEILETARKRYYQASVDITQLRQVIILNDVLHQLAHFFALSKLAVNKRLWNDACILYVQIQTRLGTENFYKLPPVEGYETKKPRYLSILTTSAIRLTNDFPRHAYALLDKVHMFICPDPSKQSQVSEELMPLLKRVLKQKELCLPQDD